jgi:hypothetical protein
MFKPGFIEVVDFVPLRTACLAGALNPAVFDRGALLTAAAFAVLVAAFLAGTGCLDASADGAATWVRLAEALLAGDLLFPGLAAAALRDPARSAKGRRAAGGVGGSVATTAGAGCVVLDPNAAWTIASASSSESWRVSRVTFISCAWAGEREWRFRSQCSTRGDLAAPTLAPLDGSNRDLAHCAPPRE